MRFYEGADGLKTGHTDAAGYCLAATAKRNGLRLIAIVLGENSAATRNSETMELLDYGYQNVRVNLVKKKGEVVKKVKLDKATDEIVNIILKDDLGVIENVGASAKEYEYEVKVNNIKLPVKTGDEVGKIVVFSNSRKVKEGSLTVDKNIEPLSFFKLFKREFIDLFSGDF